MTLIAFVVGVVVGAAAVGAYFLFQAMKNMARM